jgi:hypothetical protein
VDLVRASPGSPEADPFLNSGGDDDVLAFACNASTSNGYPHSDRGRIGGSAVNGGKNMEKNRNAHNSATILITVTIALAFYGGMIMGIRVLQQTIQTDRSPEEIRRAAIETHRFLGGNILLTENGFVIYRGTNGISLASFVNLAASITIRHPHETTYEIQTYLNWNAGSLPILLIFLFWPAALMYFTFDPSQAYQYALGQIQYRLQSDSRVQFQ